MLAVQEYLRSSKTHLEDLAAEFFIEANFCASMDVVALNYNQIFSPMNEQICQECRALYLEVDTWDVVSRSFSKFFNFGETEAKPVEEYFEWYNWQTEVKIDGTLICVYYYKDKWHIGTRSRADASGGVGSVNNSLMTFRDLALLTIKDMGLAFDEFTEGLNPNVFYSFELCCPENIVMVHHTVRTMILIGAWDKNTLEELDINLLIIPKYINKNGHISQYSKCDLNDINKELEKMNPFEHEGFVIRDSKFRRLKMKAPAYVLACRALTRIATEKNRLELILHGGMDDIMPFLTEGQKELIQTQRDQLTHLAQKVQTEFNLISHLPTQKEFALEAVKSVNKALLFELRKGKNLDDCIQSLSTERLLDLLHPVTP